MQKLQNSLNWNFSQRFPTVLLLARFLISASIFRKLFPKVFSNFLLKFSHDFPKFTENFAKSVQGTLQKFMQSLKIFPKLFPTIYKIAKNLNNIKWIFGISDKHNNAQNSKLSPLFYAQITLSTCQPVIKFFIFFPEILSRHYRFGKHQFSVHTTKKNTFLHQLCRFFPNIENREGDEFPIFIFGSQSQEGSFLGIVT